MSAPVQISRDKYTVAVSICEINYLCCNILKLCDHNNYMEYVHQQDDDTFVPFKYSTIIFRQTNVNVGNLETTPLS